jgi:iron complex outermembrane receptor protein
MRKKRLPVRNVLPLLLLLVSSFGFAQNKIIKGKVTDSKDGSPVVGASVVPKGSTTGTTTGADGNFSLPVDNQIKTLVISYIGFTPQEVKIGSGDLNLAVSMVAASGSLNEVVVIGYGTTRRKELTGSIAVVGAKDFQQGAITTPEQLIAGKVAGVSVTSNGGQPGSGSTIRIRGGASLNASNDPLIVIDGVPLSNNSIAGISNPLSLINPNDIETFTVLKDAASTAIYGSRASNGVILITTKRGRPGKAVFNFNTQLSVGKITKEIPVLSAAQFRYTADTLARFHPDKVNPGDTALFGTANTDWQKQIYQTAISTDNNLSMAGSVANVPYRVNIGYLDQQGILITDHLQRTSASVRFSPSFFDNHLKIDLNLNGSYANTRFANQGAIGAAVAFDPTQPVHDSKSPFGGYYEWYTTSGGVANPNPNATKNPVALLEQRFDKSTTQRSFGNIQLDYKFHFLPDLHAVLNLGYDIAKGDGTVNVPANAAQSFSTMGNNDNYLSRVKNKVGQFYFNYVKSIASAKSTINATAGYEYNDFLTTNYNYYKHRANGDTIPGTAPVVPFDKPQYTLISYYARLIYTFKNKYILDASLRADGSSKFGPLDAGFLQKYRWGKFPSVAFTWRLNQEDFMKDIGFLSDLKLRASYGVTGQQDGIPYYNYLPTYFLSQTSSQYQFGNSFYSGYSPSPYVSNFTWEETAASDFGIDFGFLNNRITGTIDYYYKKTKNLISNVFIPVGSNYTNQLNLNVGNMEDRGLEFTINAVPVQTSDLKWDLGFNIAYNNFNITNLSLPGVKNPGNVPTGGISGATGQTIQIQTVGYTPNSFFVYHQVYNQAGKPIEGLYADLNRDGVINDQDRYRYKSPFPRYVLGFSTQVVYKKWTFNTVLRSNIDNYMYNNVASNLAVARNMLNPNNFLENAPSAFFKTGFFNNQYQSDFYIENASFLRMDNLGVAYNVGKVFNNKVNLRILANCQNVFVITKYTGVDPEIYGGIDNNFYPRPRTYTLGVNLGF